MNRDRWSRRLRGAVATVALWLSFGSTPGRAIEELDVEENIADLLPASFPGTERPSDPTTRPWALLPQLGYGPDTGPVVGIKFAHRDLLVEHANLDLNAVYALNQQQSVGLSIGSPHLRNDRVLVLLRAKYDLDPQHDFFGLGNNDVGPDPASTHEFQEIAAGLTVGWRPWQRVALNFAIGLRQVDIRNGNRLDDCNGVSPCPYTPEAFPGLPGIDGGTINPLAFSLVWNTRNDVMRPTRGWRFILKIVNANQAFSTFKFTRFFIDGGYLRSFNHRRFVVGVRLNGEYIEAKAGQVPFWEMSELGGQDTLRGFFPHRFVGKARVLLNGELRAKLVAFTFFDLWRVRIDGVLFGDAGRVFIDSQDLEDEFQLDSSIISRIINDFKYSYGFGLRIALAQALVARIDVGFSEENTGLLYLSFGHTF